MIHKEIVEKYRPRILKHLNRLRAELIDLELGTVSEPYEMEDVHYVLSIRYGAGESDSADVGFRIMWSEDWDGEKGGVNFGVEVVHYEGIDWGGLIPYNFTDSVWVPRQKDAAVEERFKLVEGADLDDLVYMIDERVKKENAKFPGTSASEETSTP